MVSPKGRSVARHPGRASTTAIAPVSRPHPLHRHTRACTPTTSDRFHRSSPGREGGRALRFFERPQSTASLRIFTSSIFFPRSRCSSMISLIAADSSRCGYSKFTCLDRCQTALLVLLALREHLVSVDAIPTRHSRYRSSQFQRFEHGEDFPCAVRRRWRPAGSEYRRIPCHNQAYR